MACLRHEIAAKIGPTAIAGELATSQQSNISGSKEASQSDQNDSETANNEHPTDQDKFNQLFNLSALIKLVSMHKINILAFFMAFLIGRYFSTGRKASLTNQVISSYDLELEVMREMNISRIPSHSNSRSWASPKFKRTHSQLHNLHSDFATVRKSIWYTLQRVNELERRVYKAEMAALLGDRLLACYDQSDSPACLQLQKQWKSLLKGEGES